MDNFQKNIPLLMRFIFGVFQFLDHFLTRKIAFALTRPFRKIYYRKLISILKKGRKGKTINIDRKENLSLEEFKKQYLKKNKPVILSGVGSNWDAMKEWTLDYFEKEYGNDDTVVFDPLDASTVEKLKMKSFIDQLKKGSDKYYRFYPFLQRHPKEKEKVNLDYINERMHKYSKYKTSNMFIGPKNSYTSLHLENAPNLFLQIEGEKEWYLYPNYYIPIIDPDPVIRNYRAAPIRKEYGPFNPFEPEYEGKYELYEYIDKIHVEMSRGDILYIPPYYWHAVRNKEASIGLRTGWISFDVNFLKQPFYSVLDVLTVFPPIWLSLKRSLKDQNENHV